MTIVDQVPLSRSIDYAWNRIRRFHNAERVAHSLVAERGIPKTQLENVKKQAHQIRHCLLQAKEYYDAAAIASLATRPVQLYYACMALALAEILWKGTGDESLDRLRGTHRHHGLSLALPSSDEKIKELRTDTARAKPMVVGSKRKGTFAVWHKFANHPPLVGSISRVYENGGRTTTTSICLHTDKRQKHPFPVSGISILDCLKHIPLLRSDIAVFGIQSELARARIEYEYKDHDQLILANQKFHFQPENPTAAKKAKEAILIDPNLTEMTRVVEFTNGGFSLAVLEARDSTEITLPGARPEIIFPEGMNFNSKDIFFFHDQFGLNEFGFIYCGLYISGMLCRYFPDLWMREMEKSTDFSILMHYFLDAARQRLPILLLEQLEGTIILYDD